MDERWLPIPGWEGLYEASDQGRIRSVPRTVRLGNRWGGVSERPMPGRVLSPDIVKGGYGIVQLCRDGEIERRPVHVLVLETFVGPRPEGQVACHGPAKLPDGSLDDSLSNVSWGTQSKNLGEDKRRDGTIHIGERNGSAKLTEDDVREIRRLYESTRHLARPSRWSQKALAVRYGVGQPVISSVIRRETWAHVA